MVWDLIEDFISRWYLSPGYNIVNTLTYGLVLGVFVFKLTPWLRRVIGAIDRWFVFMMVPFILYGSTLRELVDQDLGLYAGNTVYPANYMLVSPGIYFTMFFLTLGCLLAGLGLQKLRGWDYRITTGVLGGLFFAYNLALIVTNIRHPGNLASILFFFVISVIVLFCLKFLFKLNFLNFEGNAYLVLVHFFDASTTFVGVDLLGHAEKHVVPTFFINLLGTAAVMYPLKLLVLLPALYVIDDEMKDDEFGRRFIKFVILVLGAGPAIRNTILLIMG